MKETLQQYAGYNIWANKRLIETMQQLEQSQLDKEVNSSFTTIRKTVYHAWSAEYIWLQRLQLIEHPVWIEAKFDGAFEEACIKWKDTSLQLQQFIERQYNDAAFDHVFQYYNMKKQSFKNRVADVLMHVFNHSTYHRGQLITMLRQVGVKQVPGTDFIVYVRK